MPYQKKNLKKTYQLLEISYYLIENKSKLIQLIIYLIYITYNLISYYSLMLIQY